MATYINRYYQFTFLHNVEKYIFSILFKLQTNLYRIYLPKMDQRTWDKWLIHAHIQRKDSQSQHLYYHRFATVMTVAILIKISNYFIYIYYIFYMSVVDMCRYCLTWFPTSERFLAATKQLNEWYFLSVCPSACLSVCLSHLFDYIPLIVSSWYFQELLPMTKVTSMQTIKVRGQRSRSQRSTPNLAVSGP